MEYSYRITDASGTITTGGTSQAPIAKDIKRRYLFIQNPRAETETLFVNYTTAAGTTNGSVELGPGDAIEMLLSSGITTEVVNVLAATTGHRFIAKWA